MKCQHPGGKCFALGAERECLALSDTLFSRPCPFYKEGKTDYTAKFVFEGTSGVWAKVRGYDGRYFVSNLGEVMNSHKVMMGIHYYNGKAFVRLYDGDNVARVYVDRLVADAFVPGAGKGKVCHKDGNLLNCKAENLYRK